MRLYGETRPMLPLLVALSLCGAYVPFANAVPDVPGVGEYEVVQYLEQISDASIDEKVLSELRMKIQLDIKGKIDEAILCDDTAADALPKELIQIGRAIRRMCSHHGKAQAGVVDAAALMHLGPIAFRAYLDAAKQRDLGEEASRYLLSLGGLFTLDNLLRSRSTDPNIIQGRWEDEFLGDCCVAVCDTMSGIKRLLASSIASGSTMSQQELDRLVQTMHVIRELGNVVEVNDVPAFQYAMISPERHGTDIGNASIAPMVELAKVIMDPLLPVTVKGPVVEALGAISSAYDVFFQAVDSLPDRAKAELPQLESLIDLAVPPLARLFLKKMTTPSKYSWEEYPTHMTAEFVSLLSSADTDTQCCAATALGSTIPAAMSFVELMADVLLITGEGLRPDQARDVFDTASSSFEAIFALATAAVGDDPALRLCARDSLDRIFASPRGVRNEAKINVVIEKLVALLGAVQHAERPARESARPGMQYALENELFNALSAIPLATRETVSHMEQVERRPPKRRVRNDAQEIRRHLQRLAETAAVAIRGELESDTNLYRARRYLLILRLYGDALPQRTLHYFRLLEALAKPDSETVLATKRHIAKETLDTFRTADGATRQLPKHMLTMWREEISMWREEPANRNQDQVMWQYLGEIDGEIGRLILEGYSLRYRLWRWFSQLHFAAKVSLVGGAFWGLLLATVFILWLVVPWQLTVWAMESEAREDFPKFSKHVRDFLMLIRWLGCSNRALDAWVTKYRDELVSRTFRLEDESHPIGEEVPDRVEYLIDHYVDLGNRAQIEMFSDAIRTEQELAVWIEGEGGGSGKTTLACYMAYVACAEAGRTVIPVIVNVDWGQSLLDTVRRECHVDNRLLTPAMLRNLAYRGRIILIVDGLSEIRESLDGERTAFRHVLVTSRNRAPEGVKYLTLKVSSLKIDDSKRLIAFIGAYTEDKQVRERSLYLVRRLADAAGRIRPVFAWLAISHVEEHSDSPIDGDHESQFDLIVACVKRQRPRGEGALSEQSYNSASGLIAYSVIHQWWAPRMVPRETIRKELSAKSKETPYYCSKKDKIPGEEIPGDVVLAQLEQCGLLKSGSVRQSSSASREFYISFAHDVIAEYLAAIHILNWPEIPISTRDEIKRSHGEFAGIFESVEKALSNGFSTIDHTDDTDVM